MGPMPEVKLPILALIPSKLQNNKSRSNRSNWGIGKGQTVRGQMSKVKGSGHRSKVNFPILVFSKSKSIVAILVLRFDVKGQVNVKSTVKFSGSRTEFKVIFFSIIG